MKSNLMRSILVLAVLAPFSRGASAAVSVNISVFENDLAPYGSWVDVPSYGTCWAPARVSAGWQPYTVGEWAYTDYEWTWVSYDPWGGIPYHYGTWVWVRGYGWVWIPGTVWAPAWVTWCYGDSYVGWAPIPPSLNVTYYGYGGPAVVVSATNYVFVPVNRFVGVNVSSVRIPPQQNQTIFSQTRQRTTKFSVSNGVMVNQGPPVQRIEQISHTRIARQSVSVGKVNPTPVSASGIQKGSRLGVIASAPERARQFHGVSKGGPGAGGEPQTLSKSEQHTGMSERKAIHEENHATPQEHNAIPKEHKAMPREHHESPPVQDHTTMTKHHESPPPRHAVEQAPPPQELRRETPPPPAEHSFRHEPPPPPPPHEAATGGASHSRGGPPPGKMKQPAPKKQEKPPPPPPR